MKTWYLAICVQCNGGLSSLMGSDFLPMPFDDHADRAEWVDAHMGSTGHSVLLMNQPRPSEEQTHD